jgi:hypothetical protein
MMTWIWSAKMSALKTNPNAQQIEARKAEFNHIDATEECHCDRGGDDEPVFVCDKHKAMGAIQGAIYKLGGGIYGE